MRMRWDSAPTKHFIADSGNPIACQPPASLTAPGVGDSSTGSSTKRERIHMGELSVPIRSGRKRSRDLAFQGFESSGPGLRCRFRCLQEHDEKLKGKSKWGVCLKSISRL